MRNVVSSFFHQSNSLYHWFASESCNNTGISSCFVVDRRCQCVSFVNTYGIEMIIAPYTIVSYNSVLKLNIS